MASFLILPIHAASVRGFSTGSGRTVSSSRSGAIGRRLTLEKRHVVAPESGEVGFGIGAVDDEGERVHCSGLFGS